MNRTKHVKVIIRTRPTSNFAQEIIRFGRDKKSVHIHIPKNEEWGYINNQQEDWDFRFDNVLHNASQETVYDECGSKIVKGLLDGYNGTILAYGQTGAGKTFTMTGATENYKHRGIVPRAISQLFQEIDENSNLAVTVRVSFVEIYNEQMVDLIPATSNSSESLSIVEEKNGNVQVKGLSVHIANNEEEALNLLFEGETNRSIAEHQMNRNSSRSHCIFTLYVESRSRVESTEKVMTCKLNLVDLAGSERISKTETKGITLKEAMYINRSLTYLEQVIIALADKKREHIPFRQSKMTHYLRDSLGGNCNTLMIANIWGEEQHIEETVSTLRFATRMMCVTISPEVNVHYDPVALIKKYEREIKELKQELSMHDTLANRSHILYEPYNEVQKAELTKQIKSYIENESEEIEIINLKQIQEAFSIFRLLCKNVVDNTKESMNAMQNLPETSEANNYSHKQNHVPDSDDGVGEIEGPGFGIGLAPGNSSPVRKTSGLAKSKKKPPVSIEQEELIDVQFINEAADDHDNGIVVIDETSRTLPGKSNNNPLSRAEEFENYKKGQGQEMTRNLSENKATLKTKKREAKELAEQVNEIKRQIDRVREELNEFKNKGDEAIVDQAEFEKTRHLAELRTEYKQLYDSLKPLRSEIEFCQKLTNQCRQKLMTEFELWYESCYEMQISADKQDADDVLDVGEKFDRLQREKMALEDPDSLPFYNAKKNSDRRAIKKAPIGKLVKLGTKAAQ